MIRSLKNNAKKLLHLGFVLGQRVGVDVLPRHFYSEIPPIDELRRTTHWRRPYSMLGVLGRDCEQQLAFVRSTCSERLTSILCGRRVHKDACHQNGEAGFGEIEADFLFCFVATHRPRRILQIGCGVSTAVCLSAAQETGYRPEIICVEPYPNPFLRRADREGQIRLVEKKVQEVGTNIVCESQLETGDLFFVDSTHTLGPAGEVTHIILEMLPVLPAGAWVHFHDIFFPYDYSRHLLKAELFFSHETALLLAFLAYNGRISIAASLSMLHYACQDELTCVLPNYRPAGNDAGLETTPGHFPSSIYLKVAGH